MHRPRNQLAGSLWGPCDTATAVMMVLEPCRVGTANSFASECGKSIECGIRTSMRKDTHPSGGVGSSNPRRWRGKQLHHHGDGVC